ncbi:glycosyltransferase family 4 protein [Oerskovia enterophila]|uniref:D-inositol 3-phosphate glycosyltransferase n=1 Tax=Oerskovia enterophila TaxID=43678 RepID=A0A161XBJ6_9CELL|nr:glycosyltransferase family 1 protein [Oerskovia enterophila]KZM33917.1 D-inositol 3-phosphate glycosyltransferase [Oerskovia enterophila]OCI32579.1 D-inositol 3-phosphate glycosyltransferase [Oerskovia enterophila]
MRILLDATAVPADRGGVGRYVDELVPELAAAGIDLTIVVQHRDVEHYRRLAPDASVVAAPAWTARRPARLLWEQTGLPMLVRRIKPDVVHSPHYTMPLLTRTPVVVTLHDATFFTTPELHLRSKAVFFRTAIRVAARRAARLIVPSRATRDEVVRLVGARPEKFTVAYHGVDHGLFHPTTVAEQSRVRESLGLAEASYVAFLGTLEPRKNVPALIRGWVAACTDRVDPPALLLAGGRGWDDKVDAAIEAVPAHLTVRRTGFLPLEDLPAFLGGAVVVAYPSLGEGFGLPVLEAMACHVPVLTTRELSLPEVGGEAVAYCGTDAASIGRELAGLLDDPARRGMLAEAAAERAVGFTWAAAARLHAETYEAAAAH